jgi:hypothetical protein
MSFFDSTSRVAKLPLFIALLEISDLLKSFRAPDGPAHEVIHISNFGPEAGSALGRLGPSAAAATLFRSCRP